jgi:hypothetical protein
MTFRAGKRRLPFHCCPANTTPMHDCERATPTNAIAIAGTGEKHFRPSPKITPAKTAIIARVVVIASPLQAKSAAVAHGAGR